MAYRTTCWAFLVLVAAATARAAPSDAPPLTPSQRLELETLKTQLADPTRVGLTKREAALLLLTRTYPQAIDLAREFLNDSSNRPGQIAIAEGIVVTGRTDGEFVKPLLAMLTGAEPAVRAPAAAALAAYKDDAVLDQVLRLIADQKAGLPARLAAIEALGRVLEKKAVDGLVGLLDDPNEAVVAAACDTLTRLTSIRTFQRDVRQWKSWWAQNKHKPQSDWLADLAESLARNNQNLAKENAAIRKRLGLALADLYNATPPAGRDALLEEMLKDPLGEVRLAAAQLTQQRLAAGQPLPESLRAQVRARLADAESSVRQVAALLLANSADEQAAKLLSARLPVEPAGEVRQAIYQALGLLRDSAAWDQLVAGLEQPDPRESAAAAAALARLAEKDGPSDARRAAAVAALKKRYQASAGSDLAGLREALLGAMAAFGDKDLLELMTAALKDEAATVRLGAIKALERLRLPETASGVAALAGDPDRGVRLAAISAVGALGGLDDLAAVLARTEAKVESDPSVRQQAWNVAMDLLSKADADKLAALADQFQPRADAREFMIALLKLWLGKLPADKPDQQMAVRVRLGEALQAAGRAQDAAAEFAAVHAALVQANSPQAQTVWGKWLEALLAAADPAAVTRLAETQPAQFDAALELLYKRLEALRAKQEWDSLLRLSEAALARLADRLTPERRQKLQALVQEAQTQQRLSDRQRVAALVLRLTAPDEAARAAASKDLVAMKTRATGPLVEELRTVVSAAKPDPAAEKAILDVLTAVAPQLKGYDPAAPAPDRLKTLQSWLQQITATQPTTRPATGPA